MSELLKKGKVVYDEEYIKEAKDICKEWNCSFCPYEDDDSRMHCSRVLLKLEERRPNKMVNHPSHYNQYPKETIDMMVDIFGRDATRQWCVMTAFKYRMRLGLKDDFQQDLAKEQWYLNKAKELE